MRLSYSAYLFNELKRGRFFILFSQASKYILLIISRFIGKPLTGPLHASIVINYECNLRCPMCNLWKRPEEYRKKGIKKLTTSEMEKVIDDFVSIGTSGIGFTGGEPILRKDLLHLIKYARSKGLVTHLSTNGYLMSKKEIAEAVISSGLDAIGFSIDGVNPQTHDKLRGQPGSYEKAIQGIKNFVEIREKKNKDILIIVVCVVSEENLDEIQELVKKLGNLGVDYISFLPLHELSKLKIGHNISSCPRFSSENLKKLDSLIEDLISSKKRAGKLDNSDLYLRFFKKCFRGEPVPTKCYAGFVALSVDGYGDVFPCFPLMDTTFKPINNVRDISIRDYWISKNFNLVRKKIKNCRACYWNNQTELNILFTLNNLRETLLGLFSWKKFS